MRDLIDNGGSYSSSMDEEEVLTCWSLVVVAGWIVDLVVLLLSKW